MKLAGASAAALVAFAAPAQDSPRPAADPVHDTRQTRTQARADRLNGAAKATDVIGMTVNNYQDEKLGKVEDLAVDVASGRIVQVIVSTGGFVGLGDRLTAVPPGALHHDTANKVLHLDADKEKLKSAPQFEMSKWAECCDQEHLSAVYRHYGQEPAFSFIHKGDAAPNTIATRNADGTWGKDRLTGDSQWMIPAARLGQVQKASKLMGLPVKNRQNEKLGTVDNMLLDIQAGRIVAVVVSSGGFIGMGDELSAVPPTALRFNAEYDTLQLDTTKEQLAAAPHFQAKQWPDFSQPMYSDRVYRAYQVEPYFTTNAATAADNTARNVRDRRDQNITPIDQGNSQADTDTTAQIRKAVVASPDMSVNGKNVKIITNQGRVTLRGPVNTAEEKRVIGAIADRIARSENVDNQLEVVLKTSSN
jgi:sporulation protein YlmC with PRC-barrel domain